MTMQPQGQYVIVDGRLGGRDVIHRASPYCDARPSGISVDLLVIHGISLPPGCFEGKAIDDLFTGRLSQEEWPELAGLCGLEVSAHLLIRREGAIVQYVPFDQRAWHAGVSSFQGRERCNDYSIGIELEGTDDRPYTPRQYEALIAVIRTLQVCFPAITNDRIQGHCDVAPGRKTDPGPAFDWDGLWRGLAGR